MKLLVLTFIFSFSCFAQTILIDPGHGGIEEGAISEVKISKHVKKVIYEKDITLDIAKILYKKLRKHYRTYLTRSVDRTVTLEERAEMASKVKADILISIHANSTPEGHGHDHAHGFETYYLDNHANAAVSKVERLENVEHIHNGKDLEVNKILIDLVIDKTAKSSRHLAETIHNQIRKKIKKPFKMKDRKLKPGLFYVLALSKIPGVLLEAGFMSNKRDLKKLISKKFQEEYAESVYKGILKATNYVQRQSKKNEISLF